MKILHMRLNQLISAHKRKKEEAEGKEKENTSKTIWATSNITLMFLEPSIKKYTKAPVFTEQETVENSDIPSDWLPEKEKYRPTLMTWVGFKQMIWDIYVHRIQHAQEISGHVNHSYMAMDEHMIIFFLQKYKRRDQSEKALIEFLASLKYYIDSWPRAKTYA